MDASQLKHCYSRPILRELTPKNDTLDNPLEMAPTEKPNNEVQKVSNKLYHFEKPQKHHLICAQNLPFGYEMRLHALSLSHTQTQTQENSMGKLPKTAVTSRQQF